MTSSVVFAENAMRAARLLRLLLLLQNRGKLTSVQLAAELEVSPRTILRDMEALAEAGLPVRVHRGQQGGSELAFNYRTRLTGLAADEAEALGVLLSRPLPELDALGMTSAVNRARDKLLESLPDSVRARAEMGRRQFRIGAPAASSSNAEHDIRLAALADAVRHRKIVRVQARSGAPRTIHPVGLLHRDGGWWVVDALVEEPLSLEACGDINISARRFVLAR